MAPARLVTRAMIEPMLLVHQGDVGAAALARMRRDGVLTALTDNAGVAPGAAPLHVARALALRSWVPRRAAATGLAALWVYGLTRDVWAPVHVEVVVPRGAHPDPPVGVPHARWAFLTHDAAYTRANLIAGLRLTVPADAVASALATAPLRDSIGAAYRAVTMGLTTTDEVCAALSQHKSTRACARARNAWEAVQGALEGR